MGSTDISIKINSQLCSIHKPRIYIRSMEMGYYPVIIDIIQRKRNLNQKGKRIPNNSKA